MTLIRPAAFDRLLLPRLSLSLLTLIATTLACDSGAPPENASSPEIVSVPGRIIESSPRPRIVSARLTPGEPAPGETLVLEFEAKSPTGDALSEGFLWKWNDQRLDADGPEVDVPNEARRGDTISVRLVVQSTVETSEEVFREATVRNTPEEWIELRLEPAGEVLPGTELTAVAEVRDHDGDKIEYQYVWELNGARTDPSVATFSTAGLRRDDEIRVAVSASDGESFGSHKLSNTVTILNSDPKIVSSPVDFSPEGSLSYAVKATDSDGDRRFQYSLDAGPESMNMDRLTGVLTWTPTENDLGKHAIEVRVADWYGGFALQHFELTVGQTPEEPVPASAD